MHQKNRRTFLRTGAWIAGSLVVGRVGLSSARAAESAVLTLYSGQHAQTTEALVKAFTQATGIQVKVRRGSSAQLANQIIEEGAHSPADLFYSEESPPVAALAAKGLLAPVDAATLKQIPATYAAKDGTWVGASARCRVVAYNKGMIQQSALPTSVLDFATEAWQGKVAFVPTSGAFQEQIVAIEKLKGRDAALNWLKGLKRHGRIYNNNKAALQAVENGEIATALINDYYWFAKAKEVGDAHMKSALYYIGRKDPGALVTVSAAGALKSSRQAAAAQRFLAFMVSARGQQAIVDSVAEYPLRPGIKSPYALKPFDQLDPPPLTPADLGDGAAALALEREAGLL